MKSSATSIQHLFIAITCISSFVGPSLAVPAKEADPDDDREVGDKIAALVIVVGFGAIGGLVIQVIQGLKVGKLNIRPLCTCITCPPLVGMIIAGCLARNFTGQYTKQNYPDYWADWIR